MVRLIFILALVFSALSLSDQLVGYPLDSLSTRPTIPRSAVTIPPGRPSGPSARLAFAIYRNIVFPHSAMVSGVGGKVEVFGVVDTSGNFHPDSAAFYDIEMLLYKEDVGDRLEESLTHLGTVHELTQGANGTEVSDWPQGLSGPQKDLVREALALTKRMPAFKPGTIEGDPVPAQFVIPVKFKHEGINGQPARKPRKIKKKKKKSKS